MDALWDLAWAGELTNDTPGALRAFVAAHAARAERRRRIGSVPLAAAGAAFRGRPLEPGARATARRRARPRAPRRSPSSCSSRHGLLTRDAVAFEGVPGGFSAVYPVLKALEEAGRVRRGYFVAGLGGLQFAQPGALERLRERREADSETPGGVVLAAADPANPYGAALPWPEAPDVRPQRAAGSHVVLVDGALVAFVSRGGREVTPLLPADEPERSRVAGAAARALRSWCERSGRSALGWTGREGAVLAQGPLAPFLVEAGFVRSGPGFRLASAGPAGRADEPDELEAESVEPSRRPCRKATPSGAPRARSTLRSRAGPCGPSARLCLSSPLPPSGCGSWAAGSCASRREASICSSSSAATRPRAPDGLSERVRCCTRIRGCTGAGGSSVAGVAGAARRPAQVTIDAGGVIARCLQASVVELLEARAAAHHPALVRLGPDVLGEGFDPSDARARLRARGELEIGVALLDQTALAGIGNVYKSEVLFLCGISPRARVRELDDATLDRIVATARRLMRNNLRPGPRRTTSSLSGARLFVYRRSGHPCRRCGTLLRRLVQGEQARSSYYCPGCQPSVASPSATR